MDNISLEVWLAILLGMVLAWFSGVWRGRKGLAQQGGSREGDLPALQRSLEEQVAQRTTELELANQQLLNEIHEHARAEGERLLHEKQVRALLDAAHDPMFLLDAQGRFLVFNEATCQRMNCRADELKGRYYLDHTTPQLSAQRQAYTEQAFRERQTLLFEDERDGYILSNCIVPIFDELGVPSHLCVYSRDITKQKHSERALREAKEAAEKASRAKTVFLATVSHEIRTPLNGILGYSRLLERLGSENLSSDHVHGLKQLQKACRSLLTLINQILDLSKIEASRIELVCEPLRIKPFLEEIVQLFSSQAKEQGNVIDFSCQDDPGVVLVDRVKLQQIIFNLLGNANQFTQEGEIELRLYPVAGEGEGRRYCFSVSDTGVGIAEEEQAQLFELFHQLDNTPSRHYSGSGLGLAICKGLVEKMGGTIGVDSRPGEGSFFHFTLVLDEGVMPAESLSRPSSARIALDEKASLAALDILLIEDDPISQQFLEDWLTREGHRVSVVENGRLGLSMLTDRRFDLVLTDLRMPTLDGITLTRQVRASPDPFLSELPIIGVTADVGQEPFQLCQEAGMSGFIPKPIDPTQLMETIRQAMAGGRMVPLFRPCLQEGMEREGPELLDGAVVEAIYLSLGRKVLEGILKKLDQTKERTFRELESSLVKGDSQGVQDAAHLLKGAALHLGLLALADQAETVEKMADANELQRVQDQIPALKALFERSNRALQEWQMEREGGG
ncbi:MAG: response regulator [Magnetococcales bacterium]|nr:response regulator [Magnetococcales bacterium]